MSRAYNIKYKKGKYLTSNKAYLADKAKYNYSGILQNNPVNRQLWLSDTRRYDLMGVDTPPTKGQWVFKYVKRSLPREGKKIGRENKTYRRYWNKRPKIPHHTPQKY